MSADDQPTDAVGGLFAAGARLHREGRLDEAEQLYLKVLLIEPRHGESLHLLGVLAGQSRRFGLAVDLITRSIMVDPQSAQRHTSLGAVFERNQRLDAAIDCHRRALALDPTLAEAHHNLGAALQKQGLTDEAAEAYRRAIALRPVFAEAFNNLGFLAEQQGRLGAATELYGRAIAARADYAEPHRRLGDALRGLGRLDEAEASFRRAISLDPADATAHNNLASTLKRLERDDEAASEYEAAVAAYRRSLEAAPDHPVSLVNLGIALQQLERPAEAEANYRRAIELAPEMAEAHDNLGVALKELGRLDEAIESLGRAIHLRPDAPGTHARLADALQLHGRFDESEASFRRSLALSPNQSDTLNNLAWVLHQQMRLDEAVATFERALELDPGAPDLRANLSMALLARGDMARGWAEYEWRWQAQLKKARRDFPQPQWLGEAAPGRTLLVHAEQGLGDALQFCRYASLAAERGLKVIVEAPVPLVRLLDRLEHVEQVVALGDALPAFDLHAPMMSLPLAFGTTSSTIPAMPGYLRAAPNKVAAWRDRLAAEPGPRVGVLWAGSPRLDSPQAAAIDRRRSIAPERLAPILGVPGVRFFSLQKGGPPAPAHFALIDVMDRMIDFDDTAALVANLDLVICVDTAMLHLAAGLGRPVWALDRYDHCWRWRRDRSDSAWYPTLRLYRQTSPGDWDPVVARLAADLRAFAPVR